MTTKEMLDSLDAVFSQIKKDQKREEYGYILVEISEIYHFLRGELWVDFPTIGTIRHAPFDF